MEAGTIKYGVLAALELIVSVQTSLLESMPALTVNSDTAVTELLRLTDVNRSRFETIEAQSSSRFDADGSPAPGCYLFRLPLGEFSYAEMVHPADFRGSTLTPADHSRRVRTGHALFRQFLEKGVILRARVRGVLVTRTRDAETVALCYRVFAGGEPPLTA
jgi:hypothetical protein